MTKAEQRAMEAYPVEADGYDMYPISRTGYIAGYHQAEKDLALTWEDICEIMEIREDVLELESCEDIYGEILKRFLEKTRK